MDEITRLAKLLKITGIEPETAQLINAKLRELIGKVEAPKPLTEAQKESVMSLMSEWMGEEVKQGGKG